MRWLECITNAMDMNLGKTLGDGDGQRGLACCSPWVCKQSDTIGWLDKKQSALIDIFKFMPSPSLGWRDSGRLRAN